MSVSVLFPQGSLFIHNASGVQIGNNNRMQLRSQDYGSGSYQSSMSMSKSLYNQLLAEHGKRTQALFFYSGGLPFKD